MNPTPEIVSADTLAELKPTAAPPLRVSQVATELGVTTSHVYDLIERKLIGHYKVGSAYRIPAADFEEFKRKSYHPAAPDAAA